MKTPTSTVTGKGQTTIPSAIRKVLKLTPDSRIAWIALRPGEYTIIPIEKQKESMAWADHLCGKYADPSFDGVRSLLDAKKEDIKQESNRS